MRFIALVLLIILLINTGKVQAADAYHSALQKTIKKYGNTNKIPLRSLRWLSQRFKKSLDTLDKDLTAQQRMKSHSRRTGPHAKTNLISVQGPRVAFLNRLVTYNLTFQNTGTAAFTDVIIRLIPPRQFSYRQLGGKRLIWKLGNVSPGSTKSIRVALKAVDTGRAKLIAKLSYKKEGFPSQLNATTSLSTRVIGIPAMHINTYDTEDPCEVGHDTTYVIEARNEGTAPCTNLRLINHIPTEMKLISVKGPGKYKANGGRIVFTPYPILQPAEKIVYRIRCKAIRSGSVKNTASMRFDQFEKGITDEEGTSVYK